VDALVLRGRTGGRCSPSAEIGVTGRPNLLAGEDLPPEPRQRRSRDKRARLKAAALALFGEKGYEGTSIDEVAKRSKLAVGGFYQHFRSKRQLLLALMDDLLEGLSRLNLQPQISGDVRRSLHALLSTAFSTDLHYLGAYCAWQEAVFADRDLAAKQLEIQKWTTARTTALFTRMQQLPSARRGVDIPMLARAMDSFFWNLLGQATRISRTELDRWIDVSTDLIYYALFIDSRTG
jgi:AcrR family transcriptional regulator